MAAGKSPIVGGLMIVVGAALMVLTAGLSTPVSAALYSAGVGLIVGGALSIIMGLVFRPTEPDDFKFDSPTYGVNGANRAKGDVCVPVIYSNDTASTTPGHRLAPVILSAYTTPRGQEDPDFVRVNKARGQSISVLCAVAEGPIEGIADVRVNDEPVFEVRTDVPSNESANGTRTVFNFAVPGAVMDTLDLRVDGTSRGWTRTTRTELVATGSASSNATLYRVTIPTSDNGSLLLDDAQEVPLYLGPAATSAYLLGTTSDFRPLVWIDDDGVTLCIYTQVPIPAAQKLWAVIPVRHMSGVVVTYDATAKTVKATFLTAPSSGAKVTLTAQRKLFAGARVQWRNGSAAQSMIDGFDAVRNTAGIGTDIATGSASAVTATTDEAVDEVVIDIAALRGMYSQDAKDGGKGPRSVTLRIDWQKVGDTTWTALRDPSDKATSKTLYEFDIHGESTSALYWSFSVKALLKRWVEFNPTDTTAKAELARMTRSRYSVRVTRVTPQPTSGYVIDTVTFFSIQKVQYERLNYPHTALLAFHGLASEKLNGSMPRITCRAAGKRDVQAYTGGAWVASATAQSNPVWAAIDLICSARYGGGEQFTKAANIDTASAVVAAAWCDESVDDGAGGTEKRAVLDIVLDTRRPLMDAVRDMLLPAQIVPVLRGDVWAFVVDRDVTLSTAPVIYDDGSDGSTARSSMRCAHQPVTSRMSEVQVTYHDQLDDWEEREVWAAPLAPATDRRVSRVRALGVTRESQAVRYARWLWRKAQEQGVSIGWAMTPGGLRLQAGDVVRVVSTRLGIDLYARVLRAEIDSTESMVIRVEAAQYLPAAYGQNAAAQVILRPRGTEQTPALGAATTAAGSSTGGASSGRVTVDVVRIA